MSIQQQCQSNCTRLIFLHEFHLCLQLSKGKLTYVSLFMARMMEKIVALYINPLISYNHFCEQLQFYPALAMLDFSVVTTC